MSQTCIVYGIGSTYVHEVYETLLRLDWHVQAWVMNMSGEPPAGLEPVVDVAEISSEELRRHPIIVPMVTPGHRRNVELELINHGVTNFATVLDPTTVVAQSARIAEGVYVNGAGMIGANVTLERWSHLNRSVSIGHDSIVKEYATMGPGSLLCATCVVGRGAFIGARAVVNPDVQIGANAIVGAGAVVTKDVPENTVAVGAPARVIRKGIHGYNDLGV